MNAKQIMCPVDFSSPSDAAIAYATTLAKESQGELHFVYAYDEPFTYTDSGFASYVPPTNTEPDKDRLLQVRPTAADVPYRHVYLVGHPTTKLIEYADEHPIDLIVMGTHGRTGLSRILMGSVAEAVVRRAHCPVITIKQPVKEPATSG